LTPANINILTEMTQSISPL